VGERGKKREKGVLTNGLERLLFLEFFENSSLYFI